MYILYNFLYSQYGTNEKPMYFHGNCSWNLITELGDFIKLVNICAPCTTILKETSPLMTVLNEYKLAEEETIYELDFLYLEPFVTYVFIFSLTLSHITTIFKRFQIHWVLYEKLTVVSICKVDCVPNERKSDWHDWH